MEGSCIMREDVLANKANFKNNIILETADARIEEVNTKNKQEQVKQEPSTDCNTYATSFESMATTSTPSGRRRVDSLTSTESADIEGDEGSDNKEKSTQTQRKHERAIEKVGTTELDGNVTCIEPAESSSPSSIKENILKNAKVTRKLSRTTPRFSAIPTFFPFQQMAPSSPRMNNSEFARLSKKMPIFSIPRFSPMDQKKPPIPMIAFIFLIES